MKQQSREEQFFMSTEEPEIYKWYAQQMNSFTINMASDTLILMQVGAWEIWAGEEKKYNQK
jgi:hypothetical protein